VGGGGGGGAAARHGRQSSSSELASERTGARRPRVSSSKRSGGQGDPYPRVLDGGLGSKMARGGLMFLVFDDGARSRLSFSGFKKQL
jgi:hypothetical protein